MVYLLMLEFNQPYELDNILLDIGIKTSDLLTIYRIFSKKYNSNLAKMLTVAKLSAIFNHSEFKSTIANLLNSYRLLLIEFKILNLEGPMPMYSFGEIVIDTNTYDNCLHIWCYD